MIDSIPRVRVPSSNLDAPILRVAPSEALVAGATASAALSGRSVVDRSLKEDIRGVSGFGFVAFFVWTQGF